MPRLTARQGLEVRGWGLGKKGGVVENRRVRSARRRRDGGKQGVVGGFTADYSGE